MGKLFHSKVYLQVLNEVVIIPMDGVALILEAMGMKRGSGKRFPSCLS